ncbi:non-ribosomal peptide synthetase [Chitinophaga solisilvae]|uniref:non-ribosomal peptide synthetase n=1 Tax=Chitinophaga solisilvae TaxID=1233460 RepID=UPI00136AE914|nr:non-ribosomal peptide synthetase [Chitinophaga solisilvae]
MNRLLKDIADNNILLEVVEGELKVFAGTTGISAELIQRIKEHKQQLISFLLKNEQTGTGAASGESIPAVPVQDSYALSSSQHRLWILSRFSSGGTAYNIPGAYVFEGTPDVTALEESFRLLIARHEILRTVFREDVNGDATQYILTATNFHIAVTDIRRHAAAIGEYLNRDFNHVFDLSAGPLLRASLYQVTDSRWIFSFVMHHIISDGWSLGVLIRELLGIYNELVAGREVNLPALRIQYKDYAAWQRQQQLGQTAHRTYWQEVFSGTLPVLELPADQPRPAVKSYAGGIVSAQLPAALSHSLRQLTREQDATLFMGLLGAVQVLLYRYTGQEDIIIGTPVAGREHIDLEDQIGFYVNTLALRSPFSGDNNFTQLLSAVRSHTLNAYVHQAYPFDALIDELPLARDMSRHPLFDVFVVLHNEAEHQDAWHSGGLHISRHQDATEVACKFDLQFDFTETSDSIAVSVTYNSDIFNTATIRRLLAHLEQLLYALTTRPSVAVAELDYLSDTERQQLLHQFNDTAHVYPSDKTIIDLFREQALHNGARTALVWGETALSYQQLDKLSNRVAHYLQQHYHIAANDLVGVELERSDWQVICLLGILKSGGAYVPVDPQYPADRIDYLRTDSGCKVSINAALLETIQSTLQDYSDEALQTQVHPQDLMYVLYTSGSTGLPKGCMLSHQGVVNRLYWMWEHYAFTREDVILQKTTFTFDVSVWELFLPLCFGATEVLCPREHIASPEHLASLIDATGVTCLHFVPSMLNSFLEYTFTPGLLSSLNKVMCSGEALTAGTVDRWYERFSIPLHNLYGPTEASIDVTCYSPLKGDALIPIGRPIWNTRMYVLGRRNELLPPGVNGEICIGGIGLAKGYLNRPELTAEKFTEDPFITGERIYRTGDTGYWRADGNIVFTGRKDYQVKVRGYRIEPGEIEHVLQQYPGISAVAVTAHAGQDGDHTLIAYLTAAEPLHVTDIRSWMARKLPSYMIPAHYVQLDAFPLTSSGKTDRRALPAPEGLLLSVKTVHVSARNATEAGLVSIWSQVLGMAEEGISITDNFFLLGGHSIKANRLAARISRHFEVKVSLHDIFTNPVLESQAQLIASLGHTAFAHIPVVPEQDSYVLSSAQRRLWVLSQLDGGSVAYNVPAAYVFEGPLDVTALEESFRSLAARHEILRTVFREDGEGGLRQFILPSPESDITITDIRENTAVLNEQLEADFQTPFDLSSGPLLRAALYQVADNRWVLSVVMHHIISDGVSVVILMQEWLQLYRGASLLPLRLQYRDYAAWEQQQLAGGQLAHHRDYWLSQLSGDLPVLLLETDKSRPAMKSYAGGTVTRWISADLTGQLQQLLLQQDATLFMGLLAAVNTLLYRYTGQEDIITGSQIAGREHIDLQPQIGNYLNTLALRLRFQGTGSFLELLSAVRRQTLDAYSHQLYPFDQLVEELSLQHDLSRHPLFDVSVVLQNMDALQATEGALRISGYEGLQDEISKFDLAFNFTESGGMLRADLVYNSDIYLQSTAVQLLEHLEQLLLSVTATPALPLYQLEYITVAERNRLLLELNDTKRPYPSDKTIAAIFRQQAALTPDKTALLYGDTSCSYRELDEASDRLAYYLKNECGIQRNELVGILTERSPALIIAILGVLKSGGAYAPLDPSFPESRKSFILKDTGARVLLTQSDYLFELSYFEGTIFAMDIQLDGLATPPEKPVVADAAADDLAYVMYTSGSTGQPKGVLIEQRSVLRLVLPCSYVTLTGNETLLLTGALSFDATTFEYWSMLLTGGRLVLCSRDTLLDPVLMGKEITDKQVDTLWITTGWLHELTDKNPEVFAGLKAIITGGEILSPARIARLFTYYPDLHIGNAYGPTENTTFSTVHPIEVVEENIPIGYPIYNSRIYIVDQYGQLCGTGVAGEICVAGDGIARGYLHQPELTAEKFVPDPFYPSERMYRTGDIGRWRADGAVLFIGRRDDQVKIRGFRVETGEITHVLETHPDITAAVVTVHTMPSGDKQLAAYVVGNSNLQPGTLPEFLSGSLPAYMVPLYYTQLESLPLNANGKVDRKRLPLPEDMVTHSAAAYEAPRNAVERQLAAIWSEILSLQEKSIGIRDNFFDLGGHSLRAIRLVSTLYQHFEVKVALKDIFAHPELESLAQLITSLGHAEFIHIPVTPEQDSYVLSSAQRRLWVLSQLDGGSVAYNVPFAYVFEGLLDVSLLEDSFRRLIARHEILRTVFRENEAGELRQFIQPADNVNVTITDIRNNASALEEFLLQDFHQPFDLYNGPLLRAVLYRLEDQRWVLSLVMHHIISDGVSMVIMMREWLQLYQGKAALLPLRLQYRDYAAWEQQQLSDNTLVSHRNYWLEQLSGELPVLLLPADKPRPAVKSYAGGTITRWLPAALTSNLKQLLQQHDATLFMGLLAAVNTLLYRYTGQEDIITGSQIAGREHIDLQPQIGNYLNTLALRLQFRGADSFLELLSAVRRQTLDAYAHQLYPFDQLVDELPLQHDPGRHPLFDVSVVLQNMEPLSAADDLLHISGYTGLHNEVSKFDLAFNFIESAGTICIDLVYNSDIYLHSTAIQLLAHFEQLLQSVTAAPALPLYQLEYISAAERNQLLHTFNDTLQPYPSDKTIAAVFREQVQRTPGKPALYAGDEVYTYQQLDEISDRVAHYLLTECGLQRDELVGVMVDRSAELLIAILGILKAGGAYVPVDPSYPEVRKSFILKDTATRVLLTQSGYLFELHYYEGTVFAMDIQLEGLVQPPAVPLVAGASAADLAYVMYTSGSTGQPKGVLIAQRSVLRLVLPCSYVPLSGEETLLVTGSLSFDATTFEYWSMLLTGGSLVLCSRDTLLDPALLGNEIIQRKVDTMWFTAGWLHELIDKSPELFRGLRTVIAGGDQLSPVHIGRLRELYPELRIVNGYGPTENTTFSLTWNIGTQTDIIPIGVPLYNSRAYIIDRDGQLCGAGVTGEICVAGDGLARGYLHQPELTAEKFVPDPFYPGERMYRTGDLGRRREDGAILFLGRKDDQVKIRGFRVETGEIAHVLESHPDITAAVVTVYTTPAGDKQLAAYLVTEIPVTPGIIRVWLEHALPPYMIPAYFIFLDELPLNDNGKVDRKLLPPPGDAVIAADVFIAPRNPTESRLAAIWSEVLEIAEEKIGAGSNFFMSGGHSLRAIRLINLVHRDFGVKVLLKDIFSNPILEQQALLLNEADETAFAHIPPAAPQDSYVLSSSQHRLWLLSQFEAGNAAYNVPGAYLFKGPLNKEKLENSIRSLVDRHEIMRTVFRENEQGDVRQYIQAENNFALSCFDLRNSDSLLPDLLEKDAAHTFDLTQGPLLSAALYQLTADTWVFSYVMHHIISDGVSGEVLMRELLQLYKGTEDLQPLRIQYKDYAVWQQEQLNSDAPDAARQYWLERLAGELPVLELLTDKARPAVKTYEGGEVSRKLNGPLCRQFRQLLQEQDATLFMGLLSALNALLYRYTGQEDIIVGSPVSGREHADLEGQIGFYVNTLALRTQFSGDDSFLQLLSDIRRHTLNAYTFQQYPFDELVEELQLQRDLSRNPLFDVALSLQQDNRHIWNQETAGLELQPYHANRAVSSKFDLQFTFNESGEDIYATITYTRELYTEAMAAGMLAHLEQLMTSAAADPSTAVSHLDYLGDEERHTVLKAFNDTAVSYPRNSNIIAEFEQQVTLTPEKTALVYEETYLAYDALNMEANRLADYLHHQCGVRAGDNVAVMLGRSEKVIIAILGILKAGAAYVPVDPDYPAARITFMLADCACKATIDEDAFAVFETEKHTCNAANPAAIIQAEDTAYIMYTSGSTGQPKGVIITHRNVLRLVIPGSFFPLTGEETLLSTGSMSFDATTFEYWGTLLRGGTLVMCSRDTLLDPVLLGKEIAAKQVNAMWFTSGWLHELTDKHPEVFAGLRTIITGGDKVSPAHISRLRSRYPALRLINGYGPTENTTFSLTHTITADADVLPIGRPVNNDNVYILDRHLQPCGIGVAGEICLSGDGLARGYLHQPELTALKFIPHPFRSGERLYRTGDIGRWQPDGVIVFVGRKDTQVKIRGFRVETGEIEAALLGYPGVSSAAVDVHTTAAGAKELAAWIVSDETLHVSAVVNYLNGILPAYMMPAHYIQLPALPLTSNGKVDRRALPSPEEHAMSTGTTYIPPRYATEERLALIWSHVLGKEKISVKDNFFELGGDSIKASRVISQVYRELQVKFSMKDFFIRPLLEDQAQLLESSAKSTFAEIPAVAAQEGYELSSSQHRLWILYRLDRANAAYNVPGAYVFEGALDIAALEESLTAVAGRHEALRTVFREDVPGKVLQVILPPAPCTLQQTDMREHPADTYAQLQQEFARPFDLSEGPLLRVTLYRVAADKWIFCYVMHHIISDGWSMNVLIRELLHYYNGGQPLTPLRIQYRDYAAWQRRQLEGEQLKHYRAYWMQQFSGELPLLNLPGDQPRPPVKTYAGNRVSRRLNARISSGLQALIRQEGATLFMGLLTGVYALLYRYTGQEDIITGSPVAGREHIDLEQQIGFYVNTIALRARFSGDDSFASLLAAVRRLTTDAYAHQQYPFDELIEQLKLQRDMSRNPLFDVMVMLQDEAADSHTRRLGKVAVHAHEEGRNLTSRFDLAFSFTPAGEEITADLTYNTDIFYEDTAVTMLRHLEQLLEAAITAPSTPLHHIGYLNTTEQQQLLPLPATTQLPYPADKTITALFTEQVTRTPARKALAFNEVSLTYGELNSQANRLAHFLLEQYQLRPDDLVAVSLRRSEKMIVAILAVLKAGAAYVPIDTDYPQERTAYMIRESHCKALLDDNELERFSLLQSGYPDSNPVTAATPDNLAYVIYTSGSTGTPKGVMITHRSLVDYSYGIRSRTNIESCEHFGLMSTIAADLGNTIIYTSLLIGGCLHVFSVTDVMSPEKLISANLDCIKIVPSHYASLQRKGKLFAPRKCLILGGEQLSAELVQLLAAEGATCSIYNHYGPTETTIGKLVQHIDPAAAGRIALGRPFGHNYVYILDNHLQLTPAGVRGEICIGGHGLAKGYLGDPLLTAEKFIPDPFIPGERIYKTGDLGYRLPDGSIVFLGRKDEQVKIRGFRIEPGEIERVLMLHESVDTALILPVNNESLIAYITGGVAIDIPALRSWMSRKLPAFMIPARFVQLEKLPITLNGKVDRKALPVPDLHDDSRQVDFVAGRNEVEEKLVMIWSEVLGIDKDKISVKDNFFELGGHSISAMRVMMKIHEHFDIATDLAEFLNNPDIESIGTEIENVLWLRESDQRIS